MAKHSCGGPIFGRLAPVGDCPRCDELRNGSAPVQWSGTRMVYNNGRLVRETPAIRDAMLRAAIRAHDCTKSRCGPICTAFDW
jgi:hypothetical protein